MYLFLFLSVRYLSAGDSVISMVFSLNLMMGLVASALLPWVWVPLEWSTTGALVLMTLIALIAHIAITAAFSRAQVSALAPFEYTALVWATIIGYLLWQDVPSTEVWTGAAIIISCGLYVIHRESLRHRADVIAQSMAEK